MKAISSSWLVRNKIFIWILVTIFIGCDRSSSPEGRMSIKIENLQKEMIDSLRQQNQAIRDSLSKIRKEIQELQQSGK